ncbi:MAG: metal-dependent transcriptional regulator [Actinobacteria bacterium]|nr:metal-dependent transcriptional regulator [Actinomycetota bacterium]MCI0678358.1 metal-dependent transcriptional regulator [Actinomycetota bacterium]
MTSTYSVRYREYAEAIWEIEEEGIPVIQARIADWLGVSPPSVSEMVRRMADEGLVEIQDRIRLTEQGRHLAAVIVRRHRLAERFLADVLKLGWDKVHAEAEVWETTISDQVEAAMWAVLEDPKTCPHGNPIPGAGYRPPAMKPLSAMEVGERLRLERISEELELDAEMMRYLDEADLRPNARVELTQRDPHGALTVRVNGDPVGVGPFAADRIFVASS